MSNQCVNTCRDHQKQHLSRAIARTFEVGGGGGGGGQLLCPHVKGGY